MLPLLYMLGGVSPSSCCRSSRDFLGLSQQYCQKQFDLLWCKQFPLRKWVFSEQHIEIHWLTLTFSTLCINLKMKRATFSKNYMIEKDIFCAGVNSVLTNRTVLKAFKCDAACDGLCPQKEHLSHSNQFGAKWKSNVHVVELSGL